VCLPRAPDRHLPEETKPALSRTRSTGREGTRAGFRAVSFGPTTRCSTSCNLKLGREPHPARHQECPPTPRCPVPAGASAWHELFRPATASWSRVSAPTATAWHPAKQSSPGPRGDPRRFHARGASACRPTSRTQGGRVAHLGAAGPLHAHPIRRKFAATSGLPGAGHPAPIKETLAAAILTPARYDGTQAFLDPMCGSGTLAIEAAMIAVRKDAPIHARRRVLLRVVEWASAREALARGCRTR